MKEEDKIRKGERERDEDRVEKRTIERNKMALKIKIPNRAHFLA